MRFVTSALDGRDLDVITTALRKNDQLDALFAAKDVQPYIKAEVVRAIEALQRHWSARQAVHIMAEVHTSRSEFDALPRCGRPRRARAR